MVLLTSFLSRLRGENVRSEVADATGNVKHIRKSLCTSPNSVLVTGVMLKAPHMVRIFVTDVLRVAQFSLHQTF